MKKIKVRYAFWWTLGVYAVLMVVGIALIDVAPVAAMVFLVPGWCMSLLAAIVEISLWIYGARYEKLVELVEAGNEGEALDILYKRAGLGEQNNTIIDSDELAGIAKKAGVKLDLE
jgi:hypothetical protein